MLNEFTIRSPSLFVLRGLGYCYKTLGNIERHIGTDQKLSPSDRHAALDAARDWYEKAAGLWVEWNRRRAATPESEIEHHRVEHILASFALGGSRQRSLSSTARAVSNR